MESTTDTVLITDDNDKQHSSPNGTPSTAVTPLPAAEAASVPGVIPATKGRVVEKASVELTTFQFVGVFGALMTAIFLYALDQLILATATPRIITQFDALNEVAWLTNGFFVTLCGFTLAFAQYLDIFASKWVLLFAIFIFELGSLICGVSPSIEVLILGRAIAGVGGAGIFTSCFQVIAEVTTLQERAKYMGFFGAVFGLSSILGPLVGGAFSDSKATWRWCFYINLPIGAVAFAVIMLFHQARPPMGAQANEDKRSILLKIAQLDWPALFITIGMAVCICLAFQYGGVEYAWSSPRVIVLLVMIPVSMITLVLWTLWLGPKRAMLPIRLLTRRAIVAPIVVSFMGWGSFMVLVSWLSIEFQAVTGKSATMAGVYLFPMILSQMFAIGALGAIVSRTGHYKYVIAAGPALGALGSGLLYYANFRTQIATVLGVSVFAGIGVACFLQNTILALQVELRDTPRMIAKGTGTQNFIALIGRIIGLSVASTIVNNRLPIELAKRAPGLSPQLAAVVKNQTGAIRTLIPEGVLRDGVIEAYRHAIKPVYLFSVAYCLAAFAAAFFIRNGTLKPKKEADDVESQAKDATHSDALKKESEIDEKNEK